MSYLYSPDECAHLDTLQTARPAVLPCPHLTPPPWDAATVNAAREALAVAYAGRGFASVAATLRAEPLNLPGLAAPATGWDS